MTKLTKNEKLLREATSKWSKFLKEGAFAQEEALEEGGTMGEYGKMDAEQGLPPTKIGRGNAEYMAAYNAVLQARGEKPLDIQKPDQAYLDALRSGQLEEQEKEADPRVVAMQRAMDLLDDLQFDSLETALDNMNTEVVRKLGIMLKQLDYNRNQVGNIEEDEKKKFEVDEKLSAADKEFHKSVMDKGKVPNLKGDMGPLPGLEGPFQFRSGAVLYYDPKAGKYYDRGRDMYLDNDEASRLIMEKDEKEFAKIFARAKDMLVLAARSRVPVSLKSVQSSLDVIKMPSEMEKGKLIVKNEYVIADKNELPETAKQISFTNYAMDYLSNLPGEQLDLPMEEEQVRTTMSSNPEMDQIEDIAVMKSEFGLLSISKALKDEGFDVSLQNAVLTIDGKYFMGKEENFDISPDEEVRRIEGTKLVLGVIG